jgi:threonine dehydrogenase-like Zn-dependent dehydrogenase
MKAIRIHGPHNARRYEDVPDPQPGPDDVVIRVRAVAICGTDVELFDGTMFYLTSGMTQYPFIPGHEWQQPERSRAPGSLKSLMPRQLPLY